MPDQPNKFYLTTPIYYVNARPHIGHAYTTIVADVLARRHRLLGPPAAPGELPATWFLTGTDEHGQKIERSAAAAGIPPQQFADQVSAQFKSLWDRMGLTYDDYIRTTEPRHKHGVQQLFRTLYDNGFIYLDQYTGAYCVSDEAFVDLPVGTPCPDCGRPLEEVTEENFFFKLSEFQQQLIDRIESEEIAVEPNSARNEVLNFVRGDLVEAMTEPGDYPIGTKPQLPRELSSQMLNHFAAKGTIRLAKSGSPYVPGALKDLSISRSSFSWGIPVPDDILAAAGARQKHVVYVWLDALANYMTAVGYGADNDPTLTAAQRAEAQAKFAKYWPADLHLIGKEITRFHCVYWPAFLLALNPKLKHAKEAPVPALSLEEQSEWVGKWLPKRVTANGWLLFDNAKMSKSRGNVVRTETILEHFGKLCPPIPLASSGEQQHAPAGQQHAPSQEGVILSEGAGPRPAPQSKDLLAAHTSTTPGSLSAMEPTPHERDLFAADVLRYFLLREIPFGQDGSFSFDAMVTRYNADLANGYGNLVSRTLKMIEKYFDGFVPPLRELDEMRAATLPYSGRIASRLTPVIPLVRQVGIALAYFEHASNQMIFSAATNEGSDGSAQAGSVGMLDAAFYLVGDADDFLTKVAPWKERLDDPEGFRSVRADTLYAAAEVVRIITVLLHPFMPYATTRVWQQLGLDPADLTTNNQQPTTSLTWGSLQPGTRLGPLGPIFPRADKGLADLMIDHENSTPTAPEPTDSKHPGAPARAIDEPAGTLPVAGSSAVTTRTEPTPTQPTHVAAEPSGIFAHQSTPSPTPGAEHPTPGITIDDFAKIDLRIAEVKVAERIPKADKLLRLEVDLGPLGTRQILSGIAEWYSPEELLGRRIIVIANLAPRKMRGLESHGMLLAGSDAAGPENPQGGKPYLATVPEGVPLGTRLK